MIPFEPLDPARPEAIIIPRISSCVNHLAYAGLNCVSVSEKKVA